MIMCPICKEHPLVVTDFIITSYSIEDDGIKEDGSIKIEEGTKITQNGFANRFYCSYCEQEMDVAEYFELKKENG